MPDDKSRPLDWDAEVKAVLAKLDKAAERFEQHVKPDDYRALEAKTDKLAAAVAAAKAALEAIEQLPNDEAAQRGPLARAARAEIAAATK